MPIGEAVAAADGGASVIAGDTTAPVLAHVIRVGAQRELKTIAAASHLARDGDTIEVDAGDYIADVAVWTHNRLTLRAVGGRARLVAGGRAAEGKAIWVVRARDLLVEGFDFVGAAVPDHNGAGIRLEVGTLTVKDCGFFDNENGILTGNRPDIELRIDGSEFGRNGAGDGLTHNIYVGAIARLEVSGSYFHHAKVGHLLKSRAAFNRITYNRLTDESGGHASYELDLPNGGIAYVIGNIIGQGPLTENPHLISFGAEGYRWATNALYLVSNTLIDGRPHGGNFLRIAPGAVTLKAVNNLLVGPGSAGPLAVQGGVLNNPVIGAHELIDAEGGDFRLRASSLARGVAIDAGSADGVALLPDHEYQHPRRSNALDRPILHPGALQRLDCPPFHFSQRSSRSTPPCPIQHPTHVRG